MAKLQDNGWFRPALAVTAALTLLRWVLLSLDATDLYVDEAQYWLWGQDFAFGYYSKPPMIGWLIGAVTGLAGSDSPFWVRMPGAFLHGLTALILAAWAARVFGARVAVLTAAAYATAPFVALGSLLMSTDTAMAPFFAMALYFHQRLLETRAPRFALLTGAAIGLALMAKYAAIYFLIGVALAAVRREGRIGWANGALMLGACGLVVSPNVVWNLSNQLATFAHTGDNIGWVNKSNPFADTDLVRAATFFFSQFAVTGPVVFAALLLALRRLPLQAAFVIPPLAMVTLQAWMAPAQANWAVAAFFAGVPLSISLLQDHPRWLTLSFLTNGLFSLLLPLTVIFTGLTWQGEPLLARQLGRASMSQQIIALARQNGNLPVLAENRAVLADLFYTGRSAGLTYYAPRPAGRARNHYEQRYPLPADLKGNLLWVTSKPPACALQSFALEASGGAYRKAGLAAYLAPAVCANDQQ